MFADPPSIIESPADVTVNENETATFNCTATGSGDLTIEWICSDDFNCARSGTDDSNDGYVTSTFEITGATNLTVTCIVNQSLISLLFGESNVEIRLPPPTEALQRTAQLIVIPAPTTQPETNTGVHTSGGENKSNYPALTLYFAGELQPAACMHCTLCIFCVECNCTTLCGAHSGSPQLLLIFLAKEVS